MQTIKTRYRELHFALDELVAGFAAQTKGTVLDRPIIDLVQWSHLRTVLPDGDKNESMNEEVERLLQARMRAKLLIHEVEHQLTSQGIAIIDSPEGVSWMRVGDAEPRRT